MKKKENNAIYRTERVPLILISDKLNQTQKHTGICVFELALALALAYIFISFTGQQL
jgi:hypothetical protein